MTDKKPTNKEEIILEASKLGPMSDNEVRLNMAKIAKRQEQTKQSTNEESKIEILLTTVIAQESANICLKPDCQCETPRKKKGEELSNISITFAIHAWNKCGDCKDFKLEFGTINDELKKRDPGFEQVGINFVPSVMMGEETEYCEHDDFCEFMGESALGFLAMLTGHCNSINEKIIDQD